MTARPGSQTLRRCTASSRAAKLTSLTKPMVRSATATCQMGHALRSGSCSGVARARHEAGNDSAEAVALPKSQQRGYGELEAGSRYSMQFSSEGLMAGAKPLTVWLDSHVGPQTEAPIDRPF